MASSRRDATSSSGAGSGPGDTARSASAAGASSAAPPPGGAGATRSAASAVAIASRSSSRIGAGLRSRQPRDRHSAPSRYDSASNQSVADPARRDGSGIRLSWKDNSDGLDNKKTSPA